MRVRERLSEGLCERSEEILGFGERFSVRQCWMPGKRSTERVSKRFYEKLVEKSELSWPRGWSRGRGRGCVGERKIDFYVSFRN